MAPVPEIGSPPLPVVVDTNVVSYLFRRDTRAVKFEAALRNRLPVTSFMTLAELDAWAEIGGWGQPRREALERFLSGYAVHYPNRDLCRVWSDIGAPARRAGRPIDAADAWIAATELFYGVPLVTHNAGDFAGVSGLTLLTG